MRIFQSSFWSAIVEFCRHETDYIQGPIVFQYLCHLGQTDIFLHIIATFIPTHIMHAQHSCI